MLGPANKAAASFLPPDLRFKRVEKVTCKGSFRQYCGKSCAFSALILEALTGVSPASPSPPTRCSMSVAPSPAFLQLRPRAGIAPTRKKAPNNEQSSQLPGFQQDADVQMLDCCALEALKVLGSCVGAAAKAGVDAIDDVAGLELSLQEGNAVVHDLEILWIVREASIGIVSVRRLTIRMVERSRGIVLLTMRQPRRRQWSIRGH